MRSWLSDSAEAAAAFSLARRPPRSPRRRGPRRPGRPGRPGRRAGGAIRRGSSPRGWRRPRGTPVADPRRGASLDKAAAARRIMGARRRRPSRGRERPSGLPRRGRRDPRRPRPIGPPLDRPSVSATPRGASCSPRRRRRRAPASADPRRRGGVSRGDDSFDAADALFSPMRRGGDASERSELASAIASKPTAARGLVLEDLEAVREGFPPGNDSEAPAGFFGPSRTNARRPRATRARAALRFVAAVAAAQPPGGGRRARIVAAAVGFPRRTTASLRRTTARSRSRSTRRRTRRAKVRNRVPIASPRASPSSPTPRTRRRLRRRRRSRAGPPRGLHRTPCRTTRTAGTRRRLRVRVWVSRRLTFRTSRRFAPRSSTRSFASRRRSGSARRSRRASRRRSARGRGTCRARRRRSSGAFARRWTETPTSVGY